MCEANQERFDKECPDDFQSATYLSSYGQLDMVMDDDANSQDDIEALVWRISALLQCNERKTSSQMKDALASYLTGEGLKEGQPSSIDMQIPFDYRNSVSILSHT